MSFSSVQSVSQVRLCSPMDCSMPGLPVHHQLPELTQTHVHWVSDAIQPSHPHHPLPLLLSVFPSIRIFSNESILHIRWPKYWSFSFSIILSNEYSGLISSRIDLFGCLAVQGAVKSLLQYNSKASILHHLAFFMIQFSHLHMTTGKTILLTIGTFVSICSSPKSTGGLFLYGNLRKCVWGYSQHFDSPVQALSWRWV